MTYDPFFGGASRAVHFSICAVAEAGLLPRLLQILARRDITPVRVTARRIGDRLHVDLVLRDVAPDDCHLVQGNLRQLVGLHSLAREDMMMGRADRDLAWRRDQAHDMQGQAAGEDQCPPT